jgi:TM2 domain-containing membrane protein YozV
MNCQMHPDRPATAYCRMCGKPLCQECERPAQGTVFCEEHVPVQAPAHVRPVTPQTRTISPGLAFVLGLIPGVGAIYNGQYVKGLIHVVILGTLISIVSSGGAGEFTPLFGILIAGWFFYMAFEAYHTASKRQRGEAVEEFSSLLPQRTRTGGFPVGPVLIIAIGAVFLLNTLDIIELHQIVRWWPVFLIGLGAYMLYNRMAGNSSAAANSEEARHEQ